MLDFLKDNPAVELLENDHAVVKDLFEQFEKAEKRQEKTKLVTQALLELKLHAAIEEELFYPAVRQHLEADLMNEADEEHHVAKVLIAELETMKGTEDHYDAKFTVLAESVRHHIKEEENEMLPKTKGLPVDFDQLAEQMGARKTKLMASGFPVAAEETMVREAHGRGDSPARAAKRTRAAKSARGRTKSTRTRAA